MRWRRASHCFFRKILFRFQKFEFYPIFLNGTRTCDHTFRPHSITFLKAELAPRWQMTGKYDHFFPIINQISDRGDNWPIYVLVKVLLFLPVFRQWIIVQRVVNNTIFSRTTITHFLEIDEFLEHSVLSTQLLRELSRIFHFPFLLCALLPLTHFDRRSFGKDTRLRQAGDTLQYSVSFAHTHELFARSERKILHSLRDQQKMFGTCAFKL